MQVRELMAKDVACCKSDSSLEEVARLMVDCDCGMIPVIDDDRKPVGTVTDRDIVCRAVAKGKNPLDLKAGDVMTTPCITCTDDADVDQCLDLLEKHQLRRMVVVDEEGRCCGIVAQADIALEASPEKAAEVIREVSQPTDESARVH